MKAKRVFLPVLLLLFLMSRGTSEEASCKPFDLVFLIDSSGSVSFTDPENFRTQLVKALLNIVQDSEVNRIGVYQFAGWKATQEEEEKARVVPFTRIPKELEQRSLALKRMKSLVDEKLAFFEKSAASDFNYAFQELLGEVLRERGDHSHAPPLWIVLISDGTFEVGEGIWTHPLYIEKARERFNKVSTRYLNEAARSYFLQQVLPRIDDPKIHYTVINPAREAMEHGEVLKVLANRGKAHGEILAFRGFPLKNTLLPVLQNLPWADTLPIVHWTQYEAFPRTPPFERTFTVYPGMEAVVVLFSSRGAFHSTILGPHGPIEVEGSRSRIWGEGEACRVYTLSNLPSGEYRVRVLVENPEGEGELEMLVYYHFAIKALVEFDEPGRRVAPGKIASISVKLTSETARLRDLFALPGFQGYLELLGTQGEPVVSHALELKEQKEGSYSVQIPRDAKPGEVSARLQVRAVPRPNGDFALRLDASTQNRICISPVLHVEFDQTKIVAGETVQLLGSSPSGTVPVDQPVKVNLQRRDGKREKSASMRWSPSQGRFVEQVKMEEAGEWTVATPHSGLIEIIPGGQGNLLVLRAPIPPWKMALGGFLLLLLACTALALYWKKRSRWDAERIVVLDNDMCPVSEHFLREMSVGFSSRRALGTPEAEGRVWFRLKGNGKRVVTQVRPADEVSHLYVNDNPVQRWFPLAEEDLILLETSGRSLYYRFFVDESVDVFAQEKYEGSGMDDEVLILEE